jgi:hypothetical protein
MHKETAGHDEKTIGIHKAARKQVKERSSTTESLLPAGSWQRLTVGVAAAAGGGLLAAAALGVGPAALAGAAGYLAYRGLRGHGKKDESGDAGYKN